MKNIIFIIAKIISIMALVIVALWCAVPFALYFTDMRASRYLPAFIALLTLLLAIPAFVQYTRQRKLEALLTCYAWLCASAILSSASWAGIGVMELSYPISVALFGTIFILIAAVLLVLYTRNVLFSFAAAPPSNPLPKLRAILTTPIKPLYFLSALLAILIVLYIKADIKYVPQLVLRQPQAQNTPAPPVVLTAVSQMTAALPNSNEVRARENLPSRAEILNKIESIQIEKAKLISIFKNTRSPEADSALRAFIAFHSQIVGDLQADFSNHQEYQTVLNETGGLSSDLPDELQGQYADALQLLQKYKDCGIGFTGLSEGMGWALEQDPDYIIRTAREFKSDYGEFVVFYYNENRESLGMDANLNLTWDDLRKKIIRFETFAKQHKQLSEVESHIKPMTRTMLSFYIEGMDNTPAYDAWKSGTGKIDEELKASYLTFVNENRNSDYYSLIQGIVNNLRKHDFKLSSDLVSFVRSQNIDVFHWSSVQEYLKKTSS